MRFLLLLTLLACGEETPAPPPDTEVAAPAAAAPTAAQPGVLHEAQPETNPSSSLAKTGPDSDARALPDVAPKRIRARHLVIAYQGSEAADPALRRSRIDAEKQARAALARARAGESLADLAMELSDGPSAPRGGDLGPFAEGVMESGFEAAAFGLAVGELSDVVETPFGFHVIERTELDEVHVAHILVQYAGVNRTRSQRTPEEARLRAEEAHARLMAGEPVATVAADLSDGPSGLRGGDLGWFQRGQLLPQFEEAAWALSRMETSGVIETPIGFHVIQRLD